MKSIIPISIFAIVLSTAFLSCNDSPGDSDLLYEATERYSDSYNISPSADLYVVNNIIGFTFIYGTGDSDKVNYAIDKLVRSKSKEEANSDVKNINLEHLSSEDSAFFNVDFPSNLNNYYEANLSLDVYPWKNVIVQKPNKGLQASYLRSNLKVEADGWSTTVDHHTGSLEVNSRTGHITATLVIPDSGYCKCYSQSGVIKIKIPSNTSARVTMKTETGTITYQNLDIIRSVFTSREVSGTIGTGNAEIFLETDASNIILEGY